MTCVKSVFRKACRTRIYYVVCKYPYAPPYIYAHRHESVRQDITHKIEEERDEGISKFQRHRLFLPRRRAGHPLASRKEELDGRCSTTLDIACVLDAWLGWKSCCCSWA